MVDLTGRGVRVLLIGTDTHDGPELESVPAVGRTFEALRERLLSRCGVPAGQLRAVRNPPDALTIAQAVTEEAGRAETVLLVYYVGHGLWGPDGEVYLAARGTGALTPGLAGHQAYALSQLRQALGACRASSVVVVLDCCFSGRAWLGTPVAGPVFELPMVHGVYLLGSAEQLALADPAQEYTAFSGELIGLLDRGDPDAGRVLTLDDAYHFLFQALLAKNAPRPQRQEAGRSGQLVLAPNAAYAAGGSDGGVAVAQSPGPSPYRSLEPFRESDAAFFCGREALTARLLAGAADRLADPCPLLVLGPSGSGKSSLLRAGLLVGVRRDGLAAPESPVWPRMLPVVTPGRHPVRALAARLAPGDPGAVARLLAEPESAAQVLDGLLAGEPAGLALLVVDQAEELFTLCADEDERERAAFVRALAAIAAPRPDGTARAVVVVALRADFYGRALEVAELAALLDGPQVAVGPMGRDELRRAIEGPAQRAGLVLGDGLVELLLHELGAYRPRGPEPGALPLLSHVLWETWARREGKALTVRGYRGSGGVTGAVAQTADATYDALDEPGREAARRMLLRLVRVGDDGADTARPVARGDLVDGLGVAAAEGALQALAAARLVTVDEDVVRISHEALLYSWPRLRGWVDEDRAALVAHRQLADAASAWAREGRDRGGLYAGVRLAGARETFAGPRRGALTALEREFLDASVGAARRRRVRVVLAAVLVVLLGVGGAVAFQQRAQADGLRGQAESRRIAAQADALRPTDRAAALELNLAAYRTAPTPEARDGLYRAYAAAYPRTLVGHGNQVLNLAYSPDGRTLVSSSADHTIRLWDVASARPTTRAVLRRPATTAIAVSPDGRLLAGYSPEALTVWDISDPGRPVELSTVDAGPGTRRSVAFRPDGRALATGSLDIGSDHGAVRLWDVSDPRRPALLATNDGAVTSVAFSHDGRSLATATPGEEFGKSTVRLFDVTDTHRLAAQAALTVDAADAVAFSPAGNMLAAGGALGVVNVWDVTDPRRPVAKENLHVNDPTHDGSIVSLAFRPDGHMFATSSTTGEVNVWEINDQVNIYTTFPGTGSIRAVAYRPDGLSLASGTDDGPVRVWATPAPLLAGALSGPYGGAPGAAYGRGGRLLVTNAGGDTGAGARLWDLSEAARPSLAARLPADWPTAVFLPDDRTLLSQDRTGTAVRLWDVTDPRHPAAATTLTKTGPDEGSFNVVAAPDRRRLAVGNGAQDTIRLLDLRDPRHPVETATITNGEPAAHLWFFDTRLLAVWGAKDIQLWDLSDPAHPVRSGVLADAADGSVLYLRSRRVAVTGHVTAGTSQAVARLWDLSDPRTPKPRAEIPIKSEYDNPTVTDDHTLAVVADHGKVELHDISDLRHPTISGSLSTDVAADTVDVSPDERMLASTSASMFGETVQVWRRDATARDAFDAFVALPGQNAEFGPDSATVAAEAPAGDGRGAFTANSAVIVWDLNPEHVYEQLCATVQNVLGAKEWKKYFPTLAYHAPCR